MMRGGGVLVGASCPIVEGREGCCKVNKRDLVWFLAVDEVMGTSHTSVRIVWDVPMRVYPPRSLLLLES